MQSGTTLSFEFQTSEQLSARLREGESDVLGVAALAATVPPLSDSIPVARLALAPLPATAGGTLEVWRLPGIHRSGTCGRVTWRAADGVLFGVIALTEDNCASGAAAHDGLRHAVLDAYAEIFACLRSFGMTRPLRIWNYLADINGVVDGQERYRVFNEARQHAFRAAEQGVRIEVPAACALGLPAGQPFTVYFLACTQDAGVAIENPRQVAAYDYPPEYGTFSPSFSRRSCQVLRRFSSMPARNT